MKIDILTLFPEMFGPFLEHSIVGRAREQGQADIRLVQWRDYAEDRHRRVDDYPYGGGAGMVLACGPVFRAIEDLKRPDEKPPETRVVLMSPTGRPFDQATANRLAAETSHLILLCGRYEGLDQRAIDSLVDLELSIGDFVLTGGELPAAMVADAVLRQLPEVLGNAESAPNDSFMDGIFDHPHYTRPEEFRGMRVPQVLLEGHHARIEVWRRRQALARTRAQRPELLDQAPLDEQDRRLLREIENEDNPVD